MQLSKRFFIIAFVILVSFGCDQSTKYLAGQHLEYNHIISYAGDAFRLHLIENKGAFLGMGGSMSDDLRFYVFTVFVALIIAAGLVYAVRSQSLTSYSLVAISLLLGGGISNLYDRIVNDGAVVDFLNLGVGGLRTGIFNVADMFIMAGFFMLLFLRHEKKANPQK